jgi:hypothetical protein
VSGETKADEMPPGWKSTDPNNLGGYWREKAEREYRATELGYPAWRVLWISDREYNDTMHADFLEGCRKLGQKA